MKLLEKNFYNTVLSTAFSPCGNCFVCGNIYGDVVIYKLNELVSNAENFTDDTTKISKNKYLVNLTRNCQVASLISAEKFLIAGIGNEIIGWEWSDIINFENDHSEPRISWTIRLPASNDNVDVNTEVNSLKWGSKYDDCISDNTLYAGCSNNKIYAFDLEDGRLWRTYEGHESYIHNIDLKDNVLVSGSEDGSVRIWDSRKAEVVNILEPYHHKEICRPELGIWIGDVSLSDDWLLCGGGVRLSLWNMRNMDIPMTVLSKVNDDGIHVAKFHQDRILAAGSAPYLSLLSYNEELHTKIETSNSTVYSCNIFAEQSSPKAICMVGNGNFIDVTTNLKFREYVLPFY